MEQLVFKERKHTDCAKWDALKDQFGAEELHAMWVADMDIQAPKCVMDALRDYVEFGVYGYYKVPDRYYDAFICWEKKNYGLEVEKEWIRFSPGVVAAFHWCVQMMSEKGDAVIVMTPVYYPFLNAVKNNQRKLIATELVNQNGEYTVDFEDFEKKIVENQAKIFILCSPHNPVGRLWSEKELKTMFEICKKHHVFIISDEIHQDLTYDGKKNIASLSVAVDTSNMVSITAPSKTFNLAGCQNSIIMIPDAAIREKWDAYVNGIHVTNGTSFGYIAATAAYENGEEWLDAVREQIWTNYHYLKETFQKELPKIVVSPLQGTYLVWFDIRAYVEPEKVNDVILNKCKLALDFGDWFGGEQYQGFLRMNLATSLENVKIGVERILCALK